MAGAKRDIIAMLTFMKYRTQTVHQQSCSKCRHPGRLFRNATVLFELMARTSHDARKDLPQDCHIKVAGSGCVDASSLSLAPRQFGEKGESFATWTGVTMYGFDDSNRLLGRQQWQ